MQREATIHVEFVEVVHVLCVWVCVSVCVFGEGYHNTLFFLIISSFPNDRSGTTATGCGALESHKSSQ